MIATVAFVFALIVNYAATPQDAAKLAVYAPNGSHVQIERTNVTGRYATVLLRNAMMESTPARVPILLERFSFGWQPLESLNFRCRLDVHEISQHDKFVLLQHMPAPRDDRPCKTDGYRDFGPPAQVELIRKRMHGPLVPSVVVIGDFAFGEWYGGGGGEKLYKRSKRGWLLVAGGGGAMGSAEMAAFGVPKADWCAFGIYDAKCPPASGRAAALAEAKSQTSTSEMLFCAYGSIGSMPLHPPLGFESQFAVAVVEIDTPRTVSNAAVSDFSVIDEAGRTTKLKRVVAIEEFDDYSIATQNGLFAHYLDSAKTRPWHGTLYAGVMRLRVRVALVNGPGGFPGRCSLTVGPYTIDGPLNGSWPTG